MIKNYLQLTSIEKQNAYDFVTRNEIEKSEFASFENKMISELYANGHGSLFYIYKEEVIGKIHIILKDIVETSTAYIIGLDLLNNNTHDSDLIIDLIIQAHEVGKKYNAKEIYFGTNSENIVGTLQNYNIRHEHIALIMKLNDHRKITNTLNTRELNYNNKAVYKNLYNSIFIDIPHGGLMSDCQIEENLRMVNSKNKYYIVSDQHNNDIGILNTKITNDIGTFDIGILKEYQNKGYGKKILDTAINILKSDSQVKEINLVVISKNRKAYDMYMNRGFVHKKIYSFWYNTSNFIKYREISVI